LTEISAEGTKGVPVLFLFFCVLFYFVVQGDGSSQLTSGPTVAPGIRSSPLSRNSPGWMEWTKGRPL